MVCKFSCPPWSNECISAVFFGYGDLAARKLLAVLMEHHLQFELHTVSAAFGVQPVDSMQPIVAHPGGGVYGYRKLTQDMRDLGESCGKHRVARLLKPEGCARKQATGADLVCEVVSLLWSLPTICNGS